MATTFSTDESQGTLNLRRGPRKGNGGGAWKPSQRSNKSHGKATTKPIAGSDCPEQSMSEDGAESSDGNSTDGDVDADEHDGDQPDVFALPGHTPMKKVAASRLAGLSSSPLLTKHTHAASDAALDGDDDDDNDVNEYASVYEISFSDDSVVDEDEDDYLRMAERDLIEEFTRNEFSRDEAVAVANRVDQMAIVEHEHSSRRMSILSEDSQQELEMRLDLSEDPFRGLASSDALYREMVEDAEVAFDSELTRWRMPDATQSREDSVQSLSQKKVRFESTPSRSSSMSSDEDPRDVYPDLFADLQDPLQQQRVVPSSIDLDAHDAESVYDFDFEDDYEKSPMDVDAGSDGEHNSSVAESHDDGDTTDEETVDEQLARMREMQKAKGKSTEHICVSAAKLAINQGARKAAGNARRASTSRRLATPQSNKKPRSGTFVHDPTRATVSADIRGSGVKLVCPSKPPEKDRAYWERARAAMSSRDGSPRESWTRTTPRTASIPQQPLTAKSTLGTLFDGNLDFLRSNDTAGIAGDLIHRSGGGLLGPAFTSTALTRRDDDADYDTDDESNVNMADFVQFEEFDLENEENEENAASDVLSPCQQSFYSDLSLISSPLQSHNGAASDLLDHLEQQRGLVTSFRTNQHRARHFSSLASHPAKRAQASELNALQAGRRSAANTPMTPARKKRASQDLGITGAGVRKENASPMAAKQRRRSRGNSLSRIHPAFASEGFALHRGNA